LNLAAREINEEANYPRIVRKNFLHFRPGQEFCRLPIGGERQEVSIKLPLLDAAVANPPYVRQEKIEKTEKTIAGKLLETEWPGLRLSGRSDLHCYFWPTAAKLLKEGGYFGFLTSSSWLDVEYGFQLQAWLLQNFELLAVLESNVEPWFPDARVKTCVTIMRRCSDGATRMRSVVKFVQFKQPLAELIGVPPIDQESERQQAVQRLRDEIESTSEDSLDNKMRIIVKKQSELWELGVRAGNILGSTPLLVPTETNAEDLGDEEEDSDEEAESDPIVLGSYAAGKWGRFLRAPDFYFEVMDEFDTKFVPLGELTQIRFGVKTGCDAFFMPRDVTRAALEQSSSIHEFTRKFGVDRGSVANGRLKIVKAGDGSVHAIESRFLAPEIHSLMNVDHPIVRAAEIDRVVLLVREPISKLQGLYVARYLKYGETHSFASKKSKPVPVPERASCRGRDPWYDLTKLVNPGFVLWPKAQQYRHIIPANPGKMICNCNLYDVAASQLSKADQQALIAVLNSTLVGLFKTFYGRFAGTEGNLKTEVVDVNLIDVPDPRGIPRPVARKLRAALGSMQRRSVGRLVEEQLMDCHDPERARRIAEGPVRLSDELNRPDRRALDEAVFELLGVTDRGRRAQLVTRLHEEAALHFRQIRVVELQKNEQKRTTGTRKFSTEELAVDLWDAVELEDLTPLKNWLAKQPGASSAAIIPNVSPAQLSGHVKMFDNETIYFGKDRKTHMVCKSREAAELIKLIADLGVHGPINVPSEPRRCVSLKQAVDRRIQVAKSEFERLAETRTSLDDKQGEVVDLLLRWFINGRAAPDTRPQ
jgi:hypothetical protein